MERQAPLHEVTNFEVIATNSVPLCIFNTNASHTPTSSKRKPVFKLIPCFRVFPQTPTVRKPTYAQNNKVLEAHDITGAVVAVIKEPVSAAFSSTKRIKQTDVHSNSWQLAARADAVIPEDKPKNATSSVESQAVNPTPA